ncbi:MAG: hypothetical protein JWM76_3473 [Pseudonocardiales bacterium]|nr:hypothetical protein [Pseudonocardiales bacterium]
MFRNFVVPVAIALGCVVLVACGGNGGHTQTISPSPSPSSASFSPTSPSTSTSPIGSSSSSEPDPSTFPTPTVTPVAQDAVNRYMDFYTVLNAADRDPTHADITLLNAYLTGTAVTLFDGVITGQARAGLAYRGTPEDPRVSVSQVVSPTLIFLTSCPLASKVDPFVQYTIADGKPVAVTPPAVPTPYKRTISMQNTDGAWKVSGLLVDSSKTCTA